MAEAVEWLRRAWTALGGFLLAPGTLIGLTLLSIVTCVVSLVCASWALRRLPVDYLLIAPEQPPRSGLLHVLRNGAGLILLLLGVAMLVLPGQGLLTILAALSLMDFRGKRRLECRLMLRPRVFAAINRFRLRSGHPRLLSPGPSRLEDG
jgi:putative transmembrane protein PGPGW